MRGRRGEGEKGQIQIIDISCQRNRKSKGSRAMEVFSVSGRSDWEMVRE